MNLIQRLGPYAYATLHSYNSAWELLLGRRVRRVARRDSDRLRQRFPALGHYDSQAAAVRAALAPAYRDYTANVSPGSIAVSLELAIFVTVLCQMTRPRAILDLGSGFSSYAFRKLAAATPAAAPPVVYSIDGSSQWLDATRRFLEQHQLGASHLVTWTDLLATNKPAFDFVLYDFGDLATRIQLLDQVVDLCQPGAMMVMDDMHVPGYRRAMLQRLERRGLSHFSLRSFTRKRMRYSYLVIT